MLQSNFTFKVKLEHKISHKSTEINLMSKSFHLFYNSAQAKFCSFILLIPFNILKITEVITSIKLTVYLWYLDVGCVICGLCRRIHPLCALYFSLSFSSHFVSQHSLELSLHFSQGSTYYLCLLPGSSFSKSGITSSARIVQLSLILIF